MRASNLYKDLTNACIIGLTLSALSACSDPASTPKTPDANNTIRDMSQLGQDMRQREEDMMTPADQGAGVDQGKDLGLHDMNVSDQGGSQDQGHQDMTTAQDMSVTDMTAVDMSTIDMSAVDMGAPSNRPQGQCKRTQDCGHPDLFCTTEAVGGTCLGPCSACDSIPGSATYTCRAGACVQDCSVNEDCPLGRSCSNGLCVVERCTNNVCPTAIFGCTAPDGICTRRACDQGQSCPQGTLCQSGYCMEQ